MLDKIDLKKLPKPRSLSIKEVRYYARAISDFHIQNDTLIKKTKTGYIHHSEFYGIEIKSKTSAGVRNRSTSKKFWNAAIEEKVNKDRLDNEARNMIVGENKKQGEGKSQLYCSEKTLKRIEEKKEEYRKTLSSQKIVNIENGESFNLLDAAIRNEENRAKEVYHIIKNLEHLAQIKNFAWMFITLTAPAEYHPNPSQGKKSYNNLGLDASHKYISKEWARIGSILSSRGVPASPDTYFGVRTVEPHKDGSIHWHLLIFVKNSVSAQIKETIKKKFPTEAASKIIDQRSPEDKSGATAASYIYKYISKSLSPKKETQTEKEIQIDENREKNDLASTRHKERVQAAIKSIKARQYQTIGVGNLLTKYRTINKLNENDLKELNGETSNIIKNQIWRNKLGFYNMLINIDLFKKNESFKIIKEETTNCYGETVKKNTAIMIDNHTISLKSKYRIERIKPS